MKKTVNLNSIQVDLVVNAGANWSNPTTVILSVHNAGSFRKSPTDLYPQAFAIAWEQDCYHSTKLGTWLTRSWNVHYIMRLTRSDPRPIRHKNGSRLVKRGRSCQFITQNVKSSAKFSWRTCRWRWIKKRQGTKLVAAALYLGYKLHFPLKRYPR